MMSLPVMDSTPSLESTIHWTVAPPQQHHPQTEPPPPQITPPPPSGQQVGGKHPTGMLSCYRLQTVVAERSLVFTSMVLKVILSTGGRGACVAGGVWQDQQKDGSKSLYLECILGLRNTSMLVPGWVLVVTEEAPRKAPRKAFLERY